MAAATHQAPAKEKRRAEGTAPMQLIRFRLAHEQYAIEITKVQEIVLVGKIARVPQSPPYIKGLIHLRNTVIPVVDLRLRFGLAQEEASDQTRIIVVNVAGKTIGIIVDAVTDVLRISREQIAPTTTLAGPGRECLAGLARLDTGLVILLDIDKALGQEETEAVQAAAAAG